jgi:hypothetical protein
VLSTDPVTVVIKESSLLPPRTFSGAVGVRYCRVSYHPTMCVIHTVEGRGWSFCKLFYRGLVEK